ncbi:MAG: hypothetical protein HY238_24290, partial [Acidobacteria bacterium]|nr:hypothetical protein [Acidobacteriota bacterium]
MRSVWLVAGGLWGAVLLLGANADIILYNGKIVTVDAKFSIVQAVAVKNGKITK